MQAIEIDEREPLDERARRERRLIVHAPVRIVTQYYGPDVYGRDGTIVAVDQRLPYPYAVKVHNVPGYPDAIRDFAWYEIEACSTRGEILC